MNQRSTRRRLPRHHAGGADPASSWKLWPLTPCPRRSLVAALVVAFASVAAAPLAAQNSSPVSVGGVVFAQYAGQLGAGTNSNFDVTRALVNILGKFSDGIATRLAGDVYQTADGSHTYRLKYAFLNWTPSGSALTYRFGLLTTPWIDWEEALWDYRMQGPTALDRNHYLSPADFGVGVDGTINHEMVNFQVSAVDGAGYGAKPGDQHKAYAGRVSLRLLPTDDSGRAGGLRLTGYAQLGAPTGGGTRQRLLGMASYRSKALVLAGEYAATTDSAVGTAKLNGTVVSVYGTFRLPSSPASIIARVDLVDPNTGVASDKTTDLIAGVSYQLSPNVRLLADVDNLSYESSGAKAITQALFQVQFIF